MKQNFSLIRRGHQVEPECARIGIQALEISRTPRSIAAISDSFTHNRCRVCGSPRRGVGGHNDAESKTECFSVLCALP